MEKEVYFGDYCKTCEYETKKEEDDPCYDCLNNPVNEDSHRPLHYKEKE